MVLAHSGDVPHYCLILDRSEGGARVHTPSDFRVSDEFLLRTGDNESRYKVVWRDGSVLGAMLYHTGCGQFIRLIEK
jgi:hypothetical protein